MSCAKASPKSPPPPPAPPAIPSLYNDPFMTQLNPLTAVSLQAAAAALRNNSFPSFHGQMGMQMLPLMQQPFLPPLMPPQPQPSCGPSRFTELTETCQHSSHGSPQKPEAPGTAAPKAELRPSEDLRCNAEDRRRLNLEKSGLSLAAEKYFTANSPTLPSSGKPEVPHA